MTRAFTTLVFTPAVQAAQARYGAREHGSALAAREPVRDRLNDDLIAYIAAADSFFIGTANHDGWPHVQHRGGPTGFLKVLDDRTLAFADYSGNRQYVTVGNLGENDRLQLMIIDYQRGRRLKIWGHGAVVDDDPALLERVADRDYPARPERVIRIGIVGWDLNCRQHFPKLVRAPQLSGSPKKQ